MVRRLLLHERAQARLGRVIVAPVQKQPCLVEAHRRQLSLYAVGESRMHVKMRVHDADRRVSCARPDRSGPNVAGPSCPRTCSATPAPRNASAAVWYSTAAWS